MERYLQHTRTCIVSQTSDRYVDSVTTHFQKASDVISRVGYNQFLYLFMVANTIVQATARPSLPDIWVVYEDLFDTLNDSKEALNALKLLSEWMKEAQTAI